MPSHALRHPDIGKRLAIAPQWPSYTGVSQLVGTTVDGRCTVYYDSSLGASCLQNAQDLLTDVDRVMSFNDKIFGVAGGHVDVIVFALSGMTDGTGGADHMGCDYTTGAQIEVCASFGNSMRCSALFEAELSECSMNGTLCGLSTGEALSRWCAMEVSGNVLSDFASAPTWFADGMSNFVDTVDPTDRNYDSIGCGMAFLSWLMKNSKVPLDIVAQEMVRLGDGGTLANVWAAFTGKDGSLAWLAFQSAISALPAGVTSDDPFGAIGVPAPVPAPTPSPTPTPIPTPPNISTVELGYFVVSASFGAVARNEDEPTLKKTLQAILDAN